MSSPSMPAEGLAHPTGQSSPPAPAFGGNEDTLLFSADQGDGPLQASYGGPPAEVLMQMTAAAFLAERMHAGGHHVRFLTNEHERTVIEIQDAAGSAVRTLSISEATELAASASLR